MRLVIQRVKNASVTVDNEVTGKIGKGYLVLVGVSDSDTESTADKLIRKMIGLRIFEDENGKTNLSLADVGGSLLLVSQFTLYANCRKGNRPSFIEAGSPEKAEALYEYMIRECKKSVPEVQTGIFGADMEVSLVNDGPFTVILDSDQL
ncbi:MAG TPA: D-tyrosyl-tRNA(Tyr) deacylase [Candidatus Mediterraneibacter excrementavium]|nr:D-tyrosyl-tRNA(Tyr) deacylase [Candidatus Mediterraneibacter excrementavium]